MTSNERKQTRSDNAGAQSGANHLADRAASRRGRAPRISRGRNRGKQHERYGKRRTNSNPTD